MNLNLRIYLKYIFHYVNVFFIESTSLESNEEKILQIQEKR